jgi:hypothetical protein
MIENNKMMQFQLTDVIKKITKTVGTDANRKQKVAVVLDNSGSTGAEFLPSITVLEKELSVLSEYVLANDNDYVLYTFCDDSKYYGPISVLRGEQLVNLPDVRPDSSTNTHKPLLEIISKFAIFKPDRVILYTDGETNSNPDHFKQINAEFKKAGVEFEIVAVSRNKVNLENITNREENAIAGMDILRMIGNAVSHLTVYNAYHCDVPYVGAQSSKIDKKALKFMGVPFSGIISQFIDALLAEIRSCLERGDRLDWGVNQIVLKKMISEIGKLLSVIFINFPENHPFVLSIVKRIADYCTAVNIVLDNDRIMGILHYGFDCSKTDKPILYTNFESHVKDAQVKRGEYQDASGMLKQQGTTLGQSRKICCPTYGVCVIDEGQVSLTKSLNAYPNSRDEYNNTYFGVDEVNNSAQAIRIAMRELCGTLRYKGAQNSPAVIFHVANQMSLMYIRGVPMNCEHMLELRKLAIVQTSMETMIAKGKYDGVGCYVQWKSGKLMPISYTNPNETHTSLYKDGMINPLKLSEPVWWALMMSMLGIFREQLYNYESALRAVLGADNSKEITEETFLEYIKKEYDGKVKGNIVLEKFETPKISVISMEQFTSADKIYMVKDHGQCRAKTWYSEGEMNAYVRHRGCVWCKFVPTEDYIEEIRLEDAQVKLKKAMNEGRALHVEGSVAESLTTFDNKSVLDSASTNLGERKIRINLVGITGSGKSTVAQMLYDQINKAGIHTLIVSADRWSKVGKNGKEVQKIVYNEISKFNGKRGTKVIIVDLCNENGAQDVCFNYDLSGYESYNYVPNFNKDTDNFADYECWCLNNVLARPQHGANTSYWLNPVSAGAGTCIKVHNMKARGVRNVLGVSGALCGFNESASMDEIQAKIRGGAIQHTSVLASRDLLAETNAFLKNVVGLEGLS